MKNTLKNVADNLLTKVFAHASYSGLLGFSAGILFAEENYRLAGLIGATSLLAAATASLLYSKEKRTIRLQADNIERLAEKAAAKSSPSSLEL